MELALSLFIARQFALVSVAEAGALVEKALHLFSNSRVARSPTP
jgi:hypothetical protein